MVGYGRLALGSIFIIISILLLIGTSWLVHTYYSGVETVEDEKKDRDFIASIGGDTREIDEIIKEHEESIEFKRTGSTVCSITALILLIPGIFLIYNWLKEKKREAAGIQPQDQYRMSYQNPNQYNYQYPNQGQNFQQTQGHQRGYQYPPQQENRYYKNKIG
jgi:hypothetical protein